MTFTPEEKHEATVAVEDKHKTALGRLSYGVLSQYISIKLSDIYELCGKFGQIVYSPEIEVLVFNHQTQSFTEASADIGYINTKLPFLLLKLVKGRSVRTYLYFTPTNSVIKLYQNQFIQDSIEAYLELNIPLNEPTFIPAPANAISDHTEYLDSESCEEFARAAGVSLHYWQSLIKLTNINYIGFVNACSVVNLLYPGDPRDYSIDFIASSGGRLTWRIKPNCTYRMLLQIDKKIPNIDQIKEIYWINTVNHPGGNTQNTDSSYKLSFLGGGSWNPTAEDLQIDKKIPNVGDIYLNAQNTDNRYKISFLGGGTWNPTAEDLQIDKRTPNVGDIYLNKTVKYPSGNTQNTESNNHYFFGDGSWNPTAEDVIKAVFASKLAYTTYRENEHLLPKFSKDFTLDWFSYIYLIECVELWFKPNTNLNTSLAINMLKRIALMMSDEQNPDFDFKKVVLNVDLMRSLRFKGNDKAQILKPGCMIDSVNAYDFIPYLDNAIKDIADIDKTFNREMYSKIYINALDQYTKTVRDKEFRISSIYLEEFLPMIALLSGTTVEHIVKKAKLPEVIGWDDLKNTIQAADSIKNT